MDGQVRIKPHLRQVIKCDILRVDQIQKSRLWDTGGTHPFAKALQDELKNIGKAKRRKE